VQARVSEELKKLSAQESAALKAAREKASEITGKDNTAQQQQDGQTVSAEVEALRARLDKRKQLRQLPESVDKARGDVVRCLLENDRRPLDCWQEVEAFKEEVRRLEKSWVDKIVR
jgi:altered-inheritance-of-mitochondria protein 13